MLSRGFANNENVCFGRLFVLTGGVVCAMLYLMRAAMMRYSKNCTTGAATEKSGVRGREDCDESLGWKALACIRYVHDERSTGKYVPVVQELSGLRVVNHGIPGGSLTPDGYGRENTMAAVNMGRFVWSKLKDIPLWQAE